MTPTVHEWLYHLDPNIVVARTSQDALGHSKVANPQRPKTIRKWRDFNLETLQSMYGGLFREVLNLQADFTNCPEHGNHMNGAYQMPGCEGELDIILGRSVLPSVSCALKKTQDHFRKTGQLPQLGSDDDLVMETKAGSEDIVGEALPNSTQKALYRPDWSAYFLPSPGQAAEAAQLKGEFSKPESILPGETKLRHKVDLSLLQEEGRSQHTIQFASFGLRKEKRDRNQSINNGDEDTQPVLEGAKKKFEDDCADVQKEYRGLRCAITQIYTYCFYAKCRYGYIINETQLLVMRIRPEGMSLSETLAGGGQRPDFRKALREEGLMEYRIISLNPTDGTQLSATLALWWLHLLAGIGHEVRWNYPDLASLTLEQPVPRYGLKRTHSEYSALSYCSDVVDHSMVGLITPRRVKRKTEKQHDPRLDHWSPEPLGSMLEGNGEVEAERYVRELSSNSASTFGSSDGRTIPSVEHSDSTSYEDLSPRWYASQKKNSVIIKSRSRRSHSVSSVSSAGSMSRWKVTKKEKKTKMTKGRAKAMNRTATTTNRKVTTNTRSVKTDYSQRRSSARLAALRSKRDC